MGETFRRPQNEKIMYFYSISVSYTHLLVAGDGVIHHIFQVVVGGIVDQSLDAGITAGRNVFHSDLQGVCLGLGRCV